MSRAGSRALCFVSSDIRSGAHFLDPKGTIAAQRGSARKMPEFLTAVVVAHASDFDRPESTPGPSCFKCGKRRERRVETGMSEDETILWRCSACGAEGRVANWQGSFRGPSQYMRTASMRARMRAWDRNPTTATLLSH